MTPRQREILAAIISEFMDSADAVGSMVISRKYDLGVSPATIRNEMADLVKQGYIDMSHSSSGRIPTSLGIRFYINELMNEEELPYMDELAINQRIFEERFAKERLVKQAVDVAAEISKYATIALMNDTAFCGGFSDLMSYPELRDVDKLHDIIAVLENYQMMSSVYKRARGEGFNGVKVLVGDETGVGPLEDCAVVLGEFKSYGGDKGVFSIVGPKRMDYQKVIPMVRVITDRLNKSVFGWQ